MSLLDKMETPEFVIEKENGSYCIKPKKNDINWVQESIDLQPGDNIKFYPENMDQRVFLLRGQMRGPTGIERSHINVWRLMPGTESEFLATTYCSLIRLTAHEKVDDPSKK
jgi:hypothetical protein